MTGDPISDAIGRGLAKAFGSGASAATKNLVSGLSNLMGSRFWEVIERRRAHANEAKKDIAAESKIARDRKILEAKAEREMSLLVHEHKKKILAAYLSEEEAEMALAKEQRDLLLNARKETNFRSALQMALDFIEESPNRDAVTDIEETFLLEWIDTVEKISNQDLRIIWARLLAHQSTEMEDRLSPNAIDLVRRVGPQLVRIFEKLGPVAWLMQGVEGGSLPYSWLTASQFEELIEVGLFKELEGAKLRFGHFTISFAQRDEAKRRTNFYGLTQAGKQIFRFLSPSGVQIFGQERRYQEKGGTRRRVDYARQFATTRSFFESDNEALKLISLSIRNLVDSRRMSFEVTGRTKRGKIVPLMKYDYQSNSDQLASEPVDYDNLAEGLFAVNLLGTIRSELKKLSARS